MKDKAALRSIAMQDKPDDEQSMRNAGECTCHHADRSHHGIATCQHKYAFSDCRISALEAEIERLRKLVPSAYNEGFNEGMKEAGSYHGGKTWLEHPKARAALGKDAP